MYIFSTMKNIHVGESPGTSLVRTLRLRVPVREIQFLAQAHPVNWRISDALSVNNC